MRKMTNLEKKVLRYRVIEEHKKLVRAGKYEEGREVLFLLRKGMVVLGLDDVANNVENVLEGIGLSATYGAQFCIARFILPAVQ